MFHTFISIFQRSYKKEICFPVIIGSCIFLRPIQTYQSTWIHLFNFPKRVLSGWLDCSPIPQRRPAHSGNSIKGLAPFHPSCKLLTCRCSRYQANQGQRVFEAQKALAGDTDKSAGAANGSDSVSHSIPPKGVYQSRRCPYFYVPCG